MTLKYARLARAENLPADIQERIGSEKGMIIIESRNPDLKNNYIPIKPETGGIRGYLETLGEFKEKEISEEE